MKTLNAILLLAAVIVLSGCGSPRPPHRKRPPRPARATPPKVKPDATRSEGPAAESQPAPDADTREAPPLRARRGVHEITPLKIVGEDFVDSYGDVVRFWGMNLVAFYPPHDIADKTAANLAERGFNMARPHHNLRHSKDWNWNMVSGSLALYQTDSRAPDPQAWDRFDYLNAALRRKGIYLSLALRWSRSYLPGDVEILQTTDEDRAAWSAAMKEMNDWHWRKAMDARKALPMIDERVRELDIEFAKRLLTHANPYTKTAYGRDAQVATLEVINEFTTEYTFVCNNVLPDYFKKKMNAKWHAYQREHGVPQCDFWEPATHAQRQARLGFMRKLDEDHFAAVSRSVRECGYEGTITFSNLWRGDHMLQMYAETAGHIEDHCYPDPFVVEAPGDFFHGASATMLSGKPYIIGEFNQTEDANLRKERGPYRTMMNAALCSYGSFHNWAGVIWFAWQHGDRTVGPDGWGKDPSREEIGIGSMVQDEMMMDHYRTAGLIYKNAYVAASTEPKVLRVDEPVQFSDYDGLMRGKYSFKPGWQNVHSIRKAFGTVPATQKTASWMTTAPPNPIRSDTGQIVKDTERKQLAFAAPKAEGFSGMLDGRPPTGLSRLRIGNGNGFATVLCVSLDGEDLASSRRLLVSATRIGADRTDAADLDSGVRLRASKGGESWTLKVHRPRERAGQTSTLRQSKDGAVALPATGWHECELMLD